MQLLRPGLIAYSYWYQQVREYFYVLTILVFTTIEIEKGFARKNANVTGGIYFRGILTITDFML